MATMALMHLSGDAHGFPFTVVSATPLVFDQLPPPSTLNHISIIDAGFLSL